MNVIGIPSIDIRKNAEGADSQEVVTGSPVTFDIVVTNTGDVDLTGVMVADPLAPDCDTEIALLVSGEEVAYQCTVESVSEDFTNIATVTGTAPDGQEVTDEDPSSVDVAEPSLSIEKATNGEDADVETGPEIPVGDPVTWTYVVSNTGNVPLSSIVVTDDQVGQICTIETLAAGASSSCEATGTAVAGQYANMGTATTSYGGQDLSASDPSHYFGIEPSLSIEKATNGEDADVETGPEIPVGDPVTWTYVVSNTGNVPLSSIVVTDDQVGQICTIETLAAGASSSCEATGTAVAGQYANMGTATTSYGGQDLSASDPSHYFGIEPSLSIEKATNGEDADVETGPEIPVGDPVTWTYVVSNTGNVPLSSIVVTDDQVGQICTIETLAAGASSSCEATGTAVAGQYANMGTATTSYGGQDLSASDPSHYFGIEPSLSIEKATNGEDADVETGPEIPVGDPVTWTYVVSNTGNVPLSSIVVTDDQVGQICTIETLAAGASSSCEATGTAVAGQYANMGTATTSYGGQDLSASDPSHYFGIEPSLSIEKATNGEDADVETGPEIPVGDPVTWTYVVSNTGNVPLSSIVVTDDQVGQICTIETLAAGASSSCEATGTAVAGQYANMGTATTSYGGQDLSASDPSHYFGIEPSLSIEKATNGEDADVETGPEIPVGDPVTWTYVVSNTGNVPLSSIVVTDDQVGQICTIETLAAGASSSCEATGTAVAGQYANMGTATTSYGGQDLSASDPSHYFGIEPSLSIEKATNGEDADVETGPEIPVGDPVTWTYVVSNTGNVPLSSIVVTDDQVGQICTIETLAAGASSSCEATGTAVAGQYANMGTATTSYGGQDLSASDPSHYFGVVADGCTLTQGYWSTHSEFGPSLYDATWAALPQGASTPFFTTGQTYYEMLTMSVAGGNAYVILAQQYIAAQLNMLNEAAAPPALAGEADAMAAAEALLVAYATQVDIPKGIGKDKNPDRDLALAIAAHLDAYNNGLIGPGHCDDTTEEPAPQ